jgi:hypothetical protein
MVRQKKNWDEDDVRINKSRQFGSSNKTRPRTKDRPDYSKAQTATIIEVDRGRVQCLIEAGENKTIITAMKARELGLRSHRERVGHCTTFAPGLSVGFTHDSPQPIALVNYLRS